MARGKKQSPEQVANVLRQIEVAIANGKTASAARHPAGRYLICDVLDSSLSILCSSC